MLGLPSPADAPRSLFLPIPNFALGITKSPCPTPPKPAWRPYHAAALPSVVHPKPHATPAALTSLPGYPPSPATLPPPATNNMHPPSPTTLRHGQASLPSDPPCTSCLQVGTGGTNQEPTEEIRNIEKGLKP